MAKERLLTSSDTNEDAAVLSFPAGKALVQTVDFFTPMVNDAYRFGQIAAANALSDVYAMGGTPWCAMNLVCFPVNCLDLEILKDILCGGADKIAEAGAVLAGGHSIDDTGIKYGLSVTGTVDKASFASNAGLQAGDILLCTKAIGTGVLATAIKAKWDNHEELEDILYSNSARLNKNAGEVIAKLKLKAATDITGFGLGGHLLEMLEASKLSASIHAESVLLLPHALELASTGLLPEGSFANKKYRQSKFNVHEQINDVLLDLLFDAQTSGGMLLAVPPKLAAQAKNMLEDAGENVSEIGEVTENHAETPMLNIYA